MALPVLKSLAFGHNLTLHQVEDETELLKALNEEILEAVAVLFGIQVEWLEGGSEDIYNINHFYKTPKSFGNWLDALKKQITWKLTDG